MSVDRISKLPGNAVTVRGLSPELKARLRVRAAHNARSMEAEARAILEAALSAPDDETTDLGAFARGLFAPLGGIELELSSRSPPRRPPRLDGTDDDDTSETVEESMAVEPTVSESSTEPATETAPKAAAVGTRRRRR